MTTDEHRAERKELAAKLKAASAVLQAMLRTLDSAIDRDSRVIVATTVNGLEEQYGKVYDAAQQWLTDPDPGRGPGQGGSK